MTNLELAVKLKFLGISTDYGSSSPESIHGHYPSQHKDTTTLLTIKQETSESLLMGQMSSPENHSSSGQLSDSYYSNESSNSTPDTERSGSKKTAYNEKWGVKVLKGKYPIIQYESYSISHIIIQLMLTLVVYIHTYIDANREYTV